MEYLKRNEEENWQYYMRLYDNKETYGLTFSEIGDLLNEVYGTDWNEAKFRRMYDGYKMFKDFVGEDNLSHQPQDILKEIEKEKIELKKERWKTRDQRRENEKIVREMARLEHLVEFLRDFLEPLEPTYKKLQVQYDSDKVGMVILSDWHIGMEIDSRFNKYNKEIAQERLEIVQQETFNKIKRDDIKRLYIAHLGDSLHGHIHTTARVQSEENVIEQIVSVSKLMQDFIEPFLQEGIEVVFCNVAGNHSRAIPNKKDSLGTSESFERLIPVMLETKFSQFKNYSQIDDNEGIIELNIKDKNIVLAHGDLDKGNGVITKLNDLLNTKVDYLITGHVHNFFIKEHGDAIQIGVGSLCGLDQYAISGRFSGKPSQTYLSFNEKGLDDLKVIYL